VMCMVSHTHICHPIAKGDAFHSRSFSASAINRAVFHSCSM
jgi:hypothetical protein